MSSLSKGVILFDGAMGTQLQAHGLPVGEAPERWNQTAPEIIESIHRDYLHAGAQVATTNTFGGSPHKLRTISLDRESRHINRIAAELARRAVSDHALVAGSIGPTGAMLLMDEISERDMLEGFAIQAQGLMDGQVDLFILETMSDLEEACIAVRAVKQVSDLPVILSFSFQPGNRGYRTMMGIDIPTAVERAASEGVAAVGLNCGTGMTDAIKIIREMRSLTNLPLIAQPNAGLPKLREGRTLYDESPEDMAKQVHDLIQAGANLIGGCCGTTPQHTRQIAEAIHR